MRATRERSVRGRADAGGTASTGGSAGGAATSWLLLRLAGAGLLIATAAIHLDLYLTGYRTIPTIGPLFLFQVVAGFIVGGLVLVTGSRLAAAAGALFALSTLGGYLLTVQFGLFGFREVRTTAGIAAGILEVAAFAALAVYAAVRVPPGHSEARFAALPGLNGRQAGLGAAAVSVVALALLGGALAGAEEAERRPRPTIPAASRPAGPGRAACCGRRTSAGPRC